jgi:hypothetical protein
VLRHESSVAHPIKQKEHLKFVPSYLIPNSMRSAASDVNAKKKRRKNGRMITSDAKRQRSKQKDPLQSFEMDGVDSNGGAAAESNAEGGELPMDGDEGMGGAAASEKKIFTSTEAIGKSTSGRQEWKMRHKRGKFNTKQAKKQAHQVPGAFTKSKFYK